MLLFTVFDQISGKDLLLFLFARKRSKGRKNKSECRTLAMSGLDR